MNKEMALLSIRSWNHNFPGLLFSVTHRITVIRAEAARVEADPMHPIVSDIADHFEGAVFRVVDRGAHELYLDTGSVAVDFSQIAQAETANAYEVQFVTRGCRDGCSLALAVD